MTLMLLSHRECSSSTVYALSSKPHLACEHADQGTAKHNVLFQYHREFLAHISIILHNSATFLQDANGGDCIWRDALAFTSPKTAQSILPLPLPLPLLQGMTIRRGSSSMICCALTMHCSSGSSLSMFPMGRHASQEAYQPTRQCQARRLFSTAPAPGRSHLLTLLGDVHGEKAGVNTISYSL